LTESFNERVVRVINDSLNTFAHNTAMIIFHHLKVRSGLEPVEAPDHMDAFANSLREVFTVGSPVVEAVLIRKLAREFGVDDDPGNLVIVVRKAKELCVRAARPQMPSTTIKSKH
jgi:hypothetical protein